MRVRSNGFACSEGAHDEEGRATNQAEIGPAKTADRWGFPALAASHPAVALEAVSLQLKWKHQFQFAGYYQALEQGLYATLVSTSPSGRRPRYRCLRGGCRRQGGFRGLQRRRSACWGAGRRLVVLAAIFQRSAAVILVARRADIRSVADLRGRTLMDTPGSDEIAAMLKREGIDYQTMLRVRMKETHATSWPAGRRNDRLQHQ